MEPTPTPNGITITAPVTDDFSQILTPEALGFVGSLAREFEPRRKALLAHRQTVQTEIDNGKFPDFLPETESIRKDDWRIAPVPDDLQDRRVEITGPVDRKMVINALNSGSSTYMADFEDSHSPVWEATIEGQINLRDAVNGTIELSTPEGKHYALKEETATLIVRPRGFHLLEKHVTVDGEPISASIFDFGLYFYHNGRTLLESGTGPYFYLPKLEHHPEARLWNDIFVRAQEMLGVRQGSVKATVLIETLTAAFEMDEILYELKDHMAGLNCGRWDYIFSFIKKFRNIPEYIFPDRIQITMTRHCMRSYSLLAIQTCHRRGAHAIGGMAAQIPIKDDPAANEAALKKVKDDKVREARDGHDGTWVAHPGLVELARAEFDKEMPQPNQIDKLREDVRVTREDLLKLPEGTITEKGLWTNVSVGLQYLAAWLSGNGCVPIYHLMEDAATAEISRTQLWQWVHHPKGVLENGAKVTLELFRQVLADEMDRLRKETDPAVFDAGHYQEAARIFDETVAREDLDPFLTLRAYEHLD